jgi:hypothetical protein
LGIIKFCDRNRLSDLNYQVLSPDLDPELTKETCHWLKISLPGYFFAEKNSNKKRAAFFKAAPGITIMEF